MTLTATATPLPTDPQPRIRIDLATTAGASDLFSLVRNDPDGRARPVLLENNTHFTSSAWSGFDYHAPFNQPVSYTVTSVGSSATTLAVTLSMSQSWLIHRINPGLSTPIDDVLSIADRVSASTATLHWAFGARFAVQRNEGVRHAQSGSLVFRCNSADSLQAMQACIQDSGVVLLNLCGPDGGWLDEDWAWISPGDETDSNPADGWVFYPTRNMTLPYQVVDTPSGVLAPTWTYATLLATYSQYTPDLPNAYTNYGNMTIDYRQA